MSFPSQKTEGDASADMKTGATVQPSTVIMSLKYRCSGAGLLAQLYKEKTKG